MSETNSEAMPTPINPEPMLCPNPRCEPIDDRRSRAGFRGVMLVPETQDINGVQFEYRMCTRCGGVWLEEEGYECLLALAAGNR